MTRGFYIIMAAQFFSALADNALLIAAIVLLRDIYNNQEYAPLLKFYFTVSYVALAAFVGAFADSMPKGRVMLISNTIKIGGCTLLLFHVNPLLAYAIVGLGAAAYSPAKYGILTELLPPKKLVVANAWIEGLTVSAIILGVLLGGWLLQAPTSQILLSFDFPFIETGIDTSVEATIAIIGVVYVLAALFNLYIPRTVIDHKPLKSNPWYLLRDFGHCVKLLWQDKLGQISLAVTTLFWSAGATLQFIVIDWSKHALGLGVEDAAVLQAWAALGIAAGSVLAAFLIPIHRALRVLPVGVIMGILVCGMIGVHDQTIAKIMLVLIGVAAGFFVVPMNAMLQHRGHILVGAGHSIAVQNFNENLGILIMVGTYYLLSQANVSINSAILLFGFFVATTMLVVIHWHRRNLSNNGDEIKKLLEVARTSSHS